MKYCVISQVRESGSLVWTLYCIAGVFAGDRPLVQLALNYYRNVFHDLHGEFPALTPVPLSPLLVLYDPILNDNAVSLPEKFAVGRHCPVQVGDDKTGYAEPSTASFGLGGYPAPRCLSVLHTTRNS